MSLAPAPHAVGVFPAYSQHRGEVALKIREKKISLTGDDFDITDAANGAKIFHVDGKAFSLHGRKEISDAAGNHLFSLLKSHFHIHTTFHGKDPASDATIFTIKSSFSFGTKLTCSFHNPTTGRDEELVLKGDFFDRKAEITYNDVPVARIGRKFFNAGQLLFDDQTYILTVAPGVDLALLAAFCICLDEKSNDQK
ncbi:hypothetical protein PUNSTDRAFT_93048 [Punctularia strigosozonata HHB-11173 SS5]|uniref:DUF567-domain-containing protein n=1 Tax=Punctularia strigosozonata (strain HHB-11173) TaxID=741275 RepID=R7S295_PUNST|nr:uncharacterized protein PUNSTDRAFT_93048 [Punctularia strigosozonata HHB-11173 SS5]EIN04318.1 hypothetical protein PUNSTDRAFT_93048 [Punctularia strigosozonata HHB-11173 SS5]